MRSTPEKSSHGSLRRLFLAALLTAAVPLAAEEVTIKMDGMDPQRVTTGPALAFGEEGGIDKQLADFPGAAVPLIDADRHLRVEVSTDDPTLLIATVRKVTAGAIGEVCSTIGQRADGSLVIQRADLGCGGGMRRGALVEVRVADGDALYIHFPDRQMIFADDQGIALTLVDRWRDAEPEGARANAGASYYVSLSNLRSNSWRVIANVSLLDADDAIDLEIGTGVGLLVKFPPLTQGGTALGLAAGVGYNLMLADDADAWYSFFGFSINLGGGGGGS